MKRFTTQLMFRIWRGIERHWSLIALAILLVIPPEVILNGPNICLIRKFLGVNCLGCGMTRAVSLFVHGKFSVAMSYNRLVILVLPGLLGIAGWQIWQTIRHVKTNND